MCFKIEQACTNPEDLVYVSKKIEQACSIFLDTL